LAIDGSDTEPRGRSITVRQDSGREWDDHYWWSHDGVRLHARIYPGPEAAAAAPPILCLPGLARNARDFEALAPHMAARRRVIVIEFRGRGESAFAKDPMTYVPLTYVQDVVALLDELRHKLGFAMVFVSHDLALVAQIAHRITVMYAGQVVEQAPTSELLTDPRHEYTQGLLGAVLSIEQRSTRLHQIPGTVPSPRDFPTGDRFAPRSSRPDRGLDVRPVLRAVDADGQHLVATPPDEPVGAVAGGGPAPITTGGTR